MINLRWVHLSVIVGGALLLSAPVHATIETYDFVGKITAGDVTGPLTGFLGPDLPVSGSIAFDPTIGPTSPGDWDLPTAQLTVDFNGLILTATGVTASVGVNQDVIVFQIDIPPAEFLPVLVTSATVSLGFQTFTDGFFSLTDLPIGVPPGDKTLGISYVSGGTTYGASTDTNLTVTSTLVPEPTSIALVTVGLLALVCLRRGREAYRRR